MTARDIRCKQMRQVTIIRMLELRLKPSCTSQHGATWWSDHRAFHQSARCHLVVRSWCIPPVSTVPLGGQIIVHSTSQHNTTWWSDHRAFHQSTQYHMVVRSWCIPPVSMVPLGGQIIVRSTGQHSTTWLSDHRASH